jgi:hypothetical protein
VNDAPHFSLELEQVDEYEFRVTFDMFGVPDLLLDEPRPLGGRYGPNAAIGTAGCTVTVAGSPWAH